MVTLTQRPWQLSGYVAGPDLSCNAGDAGEARAALLGRQVSELEAMKEHLLLAATHELNTPLHEVMGCLDALISAEGSDSLPQATRPFAQTAQSSIYRAARLVRTMMDAVQVPPTSCLLPCTAVRLCCVVRAPGRVMPHNM